MAKNLVFQFDDTLSETFNLPEINLCSSDKSPNNEFENELKQYCDELISKMNIKVEELKSEKRSLEMTQTLFNEKIKEINEKISQYRKSLEDNYKAKCKTLQEKELQLNILKDEQEKQFQKRIQDFEDEKESMKNIREIQEGITKLNIGGNMFTTSLNTLCKDRNSMIAAMFSGRHSLLKSDDGSYFIDRDGTYFQFILNYLRGGIVLPGDLPQDIFVLNALRREADFYQLRGFAELLDECLEIPTEKGDYTQEEITEMMSTLVQGDLHNSVNDFSESAETTHGDISIRRTHQSMTKSKLNFTNKNLNGISFAHTTFFHNVSFQNARLVAATFYGCEFGVGVKINFNYADLSHCDFRQCKGKEVGAKMNFAHGGGLLSASSSETFLQMIQEGRISFKKAKIENALFDPKVSAYLNFDGKHIS